MEIKFKNNSYIKSIPDDESISGNTRGNRAKHIELVTDDSIVDLHELNKVIKPYIGRGQRAKMNTLCFDYELCPKEILDEALEHFLSEQNSDGQDKVSEYMSKNADELLEEAKN